METIGSWWKSLLIFENNKIKAVDSIKSLDSSHYFSTRWEIFLLRGVHLSKMMIFALQRCDFTWGPAQGLPVVVAVSWVFILMIGILPPWLTNHAFAQSNSEITKTNKRTKRKQNKKTLLCVCFYIYSSECLGLVYFERNHLHSRFATLKETAFHRCTGSPFWFLLISVQRTDLKSRREKRAYTLQNCCLRANHWVNSWLTGCRERGFFAVIRETGPV